MKHPRTQKHNIRLLVLGLLVIGIGLLVYFFISIGDSPSEPTPQTFANGAQATLYKDIAYCDSNDARQKMDIYIPATAKEDRPAPFVFYVHGGGWKAGTSRNNIQKYYPQFLLAKGIAFVTVEYRLAPTVSYPSQNNDINCAYQYLMSHGSEYNLRTTQVGFFGDSAGGQLAIMQSLRSDTRANAAATAVLYGVTDLWYQITKKNDTNAIRYLGGKKDQTTANQASPYNADLRTKTAFLLVHGSNDAVVPIETAQRFYKKLLMNGDNAQLVTIPGAHHGFGDATGSKAQAAAQPIISAFFEKYLKP